MRHLSICEELVETRPVLVAYVSSSGGSRAAAQEEWAHSASEQLEELVNGEKCQVLRDVSQGEYQNYTDMHIPVTGAAGP